MAKRQKSQQLHANRGEVRIQNTQIDDDNFLPPAEEIAKYHEIDPTILDYIKERASKEQDHRHKILTERTEILKTDQANSKLLNVLGLIFGFIVIITSLGGSLYLIIMGHEAKGAAFFGGTVVFAAGILITRNVKVLSKNPA